MGPSSLTKLRSFSNLKTHLLATTKCMSKTLLLFHLINNKISLLFSFFLTPPFCMFLLWWGFLGNCVAFTTGWMLEANVSPTCLILCLISMPHSRCHGPILLPFDLCGLNTVQTSFPWILTSLHVFVRKC